MQISSKLDSKRKQIPHHHHNHPQNLKKIPVKKDEKITKEKKVIDLTKEKKVIDLTKEKKVIDLTKDEKKKVVIELSDDEDKPKQAAPKAKAKAAPNLREIKKQVKEYQKFTRPKPKNKPPAEAEPEKTGEKRTKDTDEVKIKETPIAAPKKKAKIICKRREG